MQWYHLNPGALPCDLGRTDAAGGGDGCGDGGEEGVREQRLEQPQGHTEQVG